MQQPLLLEVEKDIANHPTWLDRACHLSRSSKFQSNVTFFGGMEFTWKHSIQHANFLGQNVSHFIVDVLIMFGQISYGYENCMQAFLV